MKVLVVDRNNYYGGESASLNLTNLHEKFRGSKPSAAVKSAAGRPWLSPCGSLSLLFFLLPCFTRSFCLFQHTTARAALAP
jgi:hypothetical protein